MPSRISSGISNNNRNNYGKQFRQKQNNLPSLKNNFSKINAKTGNDNNINTNINNNNLEKNYSNERLPLINNVNSNNNSFMNRGNNNNLNNQLQDIESYDEENFKNIDTLMKKIMSI